MPITIHPAVREHIRRAEMLSELLSDPSLVPIARRILSIPSTPAPNQDQLELPQLKPESRKPQAQRRTQRGVLERAVLDIVNQSPNFVAAKDVTRALEVKGFHFEALQHQVSVSKALRALARKKRIDKEQSGPAKAAIFYKSKHDFPVQERTQ